MKALTILLILAGFAATAQKLVEKRLPIAEGETVSLEFKFADEIEVKIWEEDEVMVKASAIINRGKDDHLFDLQAKKAGNTLEFFSDTNKMEQSWRNREEQDECHCNKTNIYYQVFVPDHEFDLEVETISGDIILPPIKGKSDLNTISGDIEWTAGMGWVNAKSISGDVDISFPGNLDVDVEAKTVTGDIYSDLDIEFLDGKEGLKQLVGQKFRGRLNQGGETLLLETVSGNIYLRELSQ